MARRPLPEMYGITQRYRDNSTIYNYGAGHGAIDIGAPPGTPVIAPEDGVVVYDGWVWDLPGGPYDYHLRWYLIKPERGNIYVGGGIVTIYENAIGSAWYFAHAEESFYSVGDRIRAGDVLQSSGNTGSSTGPHSHIGLFPPNPDYTNGFFGGIDPEPWLNEPYMPNRHVSWQGGPTGGIGAPVVERDWFDMADRNDLKNALREIIPEIVDAVLDERIPVWGKDPDGKPYGGHTTLRHEASVGTFRGFRDRRIESGVKSLPDQIEASVRNALTTPKENI